MTIINSKQNPFDDLYILLVLSFNYIIMEIMMFIMLQLRKLLRIWKINPDLNPKSKKKLKTILEKKVSAKENLKIESFQKIEKIRKYKNKINLFLNRLETKNFNDPKYQKEFLIKNKGSHNEGF